MPESYAWETCHLAVLELAAGTGSLRERVRDAWLYHLLALDVNPIPWPDLHQKYSEIRANFVEGADGGQPPYEVMKEDDLREFAKTIVSLYDAVARRRGV
jgi:hypothetical protein